VRRSLKEVLEFILEEVKEEVENLEFCGP